MPSRCDCLTFLAIIWYNAVRLAGSITTVALISEKVRIGCSSARHTSAVCKNLIGVGFVWLCNVEFYPTKLIKVFSPNTRSVVGSIDPAMYFCHMAGFIKSNFICILSFL